MKKIGALEAGGTKMVCAVGTADGQIIDQISIPTAEPEKVLPAIQTYFADHGIDALGIGAFGPTGVNPHSPDYGFVLDTPKPGWRGYDFLGTMQAALHIPMGYDTDVNAACLGEVTFGCARDLDVVVYETIGTGIGAGVWLDGHLLHGALHPEAGHFLVEPAPEDSFPGVCPTHGHCLEGLASGPAIEKRWGRKAAELADDPRVWELESTYLAQAMAIYILCYSPQKIILGGGVMKQEQLFPLIRKKTLDYLGGYLRIPELEAMDRYIVPASLKGRQGILGCLELGRRALSQS